jgi:hypothetical protein
MQIPSGTLKTAIASLERNLRKRKTSAPKKFNSTNYVNYTFTPKKTKVRTREEQGKKMKIIIIIF